MTTEETLALLALAAQYDPTLLPANPTDRATKATAWAAALSRNLTPAAAQAAVITHYRLASRTITVADLNAAVPRPTGAAAAIAARDRAGGYTRPCPGCGKILRETDPHNPDPTRRWSIPDVDGHHTTCLPDRDAQQANR